MDIRSTINEKPMIPLSVALLVIVAAGVGVASHFKRQQDPNIGKAFYSDDDGKTWFIDSDQRVPPFDHNGRQAVAADVYRCGTGTPFVAYLEKYSDEQRADAQHFQKSQLNHDGDDRTLMVPATSMYVKRPGDPKWVRGGSQPDQAAYLKVTTVTYQAGSGVLTIVRPSDADAQ